MGISLSKFNPPGVNRDRCPDSPHRKAILTPQSFVQNVETLKS